MNIFSWRLCLWPSTRQWLFLNCSQLPYCLFRVKHFKLIKSKPWLCKCINCGGGGCCKVADWVAAGLSTAVNKSSTSFPPSSIKHNKGALEQKQIDIGVDAHMYIICVWNKLCRKIWKIGHLPGILYNLPRIAPA